MVVNLRNVEIMIECCELDLNEGVICYKQISKRDFGKQYYGLYFRDEYTFFALIKTTNGPIMYYGGKTYKVTPNLQIALVKHDKEREVTFNDYGIKIKYVCKYLDFDPWSTELDVDLFAIIEAGYKNKEFYEKYTLR